MYGMVNKAIEAMVRSSYGDATWQTIKQQAQVNEALFVTMHQYPDDLTYRLVGAASEVLALPADEILREFGRFWTGYTAREGYRELLYLAGDHFVACLQNLDNLHARVGLSYPQLTPPSFFCTDITERSVCLHYLSERRGLAPMVAGLLYGLADLFSTSITIQQIASREMDADHDIFAITFEQRAAASA